MAREQLKIGVKLEKFEVQSCTSLTTAEKCKDNLKRILKGKNKRH